LFNNNKVEQKYERYIKLKGLIRSQMIILAMDVKRDSNHNYFIDVLAG
jgi:hypothetical protein